MGYSRYYAMGSCNGIIDPQRITNPRIHQNLVHYNKHGQPTTKTIRNTFGEPNHYDTRNRCVGYSRKQSGFRINHYDATGNLVGYSHSYLGVLLVHCCSMGRPYRDHNEQGYRQPSWF